MTGRKVYTRPETCLRKIRYETRIEAMHVRGQKNLGRVYRCQHCGMYHIGHKPTRKNRLHHQNATQILTAKEHAA